MLRRIPQPAADAWLRPALTFGSGTLPLQRARSRHGQQSGRYRPGRRHAATPFRTNRYTPAQDRSNGFEPCTPSSAPSPKSCLARAYPPPTHTISPPRLSLAYNSPRILYRARWMFFIHRLVLGLACMVGRNIFCHSAASQVLDDALDLTPLHRISLTRLSPPLCCRFLRLHIAS